MTEGAPQEHGVRSIWGLWESHTEAIINVRFGDADAETWRSVRVEKFLAGWEKTNKDKHDQAC